MQNSLLLRKQDSPFADNDQIYVHSNTSAQLQITSIFSPGTKEFGPR